MGNYYYRVEAKGRKLADGNVIHLYHYAYKPSGDWRWNDRMERLKLGPTYRAWERKPGAEIENVLIAAGMGENEPVYLMKYCGGMMCDAALGEERGHKLAGRLRKAGRGWRMVGLEEAKAESEVIDALVAANTGFTTLPSMFDAAPSYRPSCDMRVPAMKAIADAYDARAEMFGDARRAYRYGA